MRKIKIFLLSIAVITAMLSVISCAAPTEYAGFANFDSGITFYYNNKNNFETLHKEYTENIQLPYINSAQEAHSIAFSYNEVSENGKREDIELDEIEFDIDLKDMYLSNIDDAGFKINIEYTMTVGRRTKMTLKGKEEGFITIYYIDTNTGKDAGIEVYDLNELEQISEKVENTNISSYKYSLSFLVKPPYEKAIERISVRTSKIILEQDIMTSSGNAVIIGLNKAEVFGYSQEEINANNEKYIENEKNRIDKELGQLTEDLKTTTPDPNKLEEQSDPFAIIDREYFTDVTSSIGNILNANALLTAMITLTFIFALIKYVFFGKN